MGFKKFVTKTAVVTAVCSVGFTGVLDKTLSPESKAEIKKTYNELTSREKKIDMEVLDESYVQEENALQGVHDEEEESDSQEKALDNIENKTEESTETDITEDKNLEAEQDETSTANNKNDNFIFVGDSRTVMYKPIVDITNYDFVTFISKGGMGAKWLEDTAIPQLDQRFATTDLKYNVVLNLGVNDLHNINKYIRLYNELAEAYPEHNFFAVSVNGVHSEKIKKYVVTNDEIEEFNNKLKSSLSDKIHYIDSYSYFKDKGFETTDGVHYTNDTSLDILNYISDYIKQL